MNKKTAKMATKSNPSSENRKNNMEQNEIPAPSANTRNKRRLFSSTSNENGDRIKDSKTNQIFRRYGQLSLLARCALDDEDEIDSKTTVHQVDACNDIVVDQASLSPTENSIFNTSLTEKCHNVSRKKMKVLENDNEVQNYAQKVVFCSPQVLPINNVFVRRWNRPGDLQKKMEIQTHSFSPRENNEMNPSFHQNLAHARHNALHSIPYDGSSSMTPHDIFRFTAVSDIFRNYCKQGSGNNMPAYQRVMYRSIGTNDSSTSQSTLGEATAKTSIHNNMQNFSHKTEKVGVFAGKQSLNRATPLIHRLHKTSIPFNSNEMSNESYPHKLKEVVGDPFTKFVQLWTPEDEGRLSVQQCWLRKQLETFPASDKDVSRHARGRNRQIALGEVGIQCIHCKHLSQEGRGKGSSYFPSTIASIYQSAQNILFQHFKEDTCPLIPRRLLREMIEAGNDDKVSRVMVPKAGKSRAGGGKSFWAQSASKIGLVDTIAGIRYSDDPRYYQVSQNISTGKTQYSTFFNGSRDENQFQLVDSNDRGQVTDFCFLLLSLYIPYSQDVLANEFDSRPSVGISCRFCADAEITGRTSLESRKQTGVFLSVKASTLMRNKSLAKLYGHTTSCGCVPDDLKQNLVTAKNIHLPQSNQLKKGWKKYFFEKVIFRLRNYLDKT